MAADRPWWQMTRTARQGFIMGTWWAVLGLSALLYGVFGRAYAGVIIASAVWLALAGAYLVTSVALRQRERSGSGQNC